MTQDLIRYDVLVQEALRGVVKKVIQEVVKTGLPGQHHFFIAFDPRHPGVRLSTRMRQRYPEEMTVVLQHQFWDLAVTDHAFEVGLSFGGIPERLLVPFTAIKGFFDPSVQFGLQFEVANDQPAAGEAAPEAPRPRLQPVVPDVVDPPLPESVTRLDGGGKRAEAERREAAEAAPEPVAPAATTDAPAPGATVISMDHFRKKT